MRTSERRQLKQDKFAETTKDTISWAVEHRSILVWTVTLAILALAVGLGSWWYWNHRNQLANEALGKALEAYNAPLRPPNTPATPDSLSFQTAQERASAAHAQFQEIASRYGRTKSGKVARYLSGLSALDMGDAKTGEQELQQVADSGDQDLSSLAKLALAGVYRNTKRDKQALEVYNQLISHPTGAVSKEMAELELASYYEETKQTAEAGKLYEQIAKDNPGTTAASRAQQRLQALK